MINKILKKFPEVKWDRFVTTHKGNYVFYGWILRPNKPRDFFILSFAPEGGYLYHATSSTKFSKIFHDRLGFKKHNACKRVELHFKKLNCLREL